MKKVIYISSSLILSIVFATVIMLANFSSVASYVLGKVIKGHVHITKSDIQYKEGRIILDFFDIRIKGSIEGQIKQWKMVVGIKNGLALKNAEISDFDLSIAAVKKGRAGFFPVPDELFEIKKGAVTYNKQRFIIEEAKIKTLRPGKPFTFEINLQNNELFETLRASGEGIFKGKSTEAKGQLNITGLNLNKLSDKMNGKAHAKVKFTYAKKGLAFEGPFEFSDYLLNDNILKKPLFLKNVKGSVFLNYADGITDVKIKHANFKSTPLDLNMKFEKSIFTGLELKSGFLNVQDLNYYIAFKKIAKTDFDIWDYIIDGNVKINSLIYDKKRPLYMDLAINDIGLSYKDMLFTDVQGAIALTGNKLNISNVKGTFKSSSFHNINGSISLSKEKELNINGNYSCSLEDISSITGAGGISFKDGRTEGKIDFRGNKNRGFKIKGEGRFDNADITWKKSIVSAKGEYKLNNDEIVFDPLIVNGGSTDVVIRGKWQNKFINLKIKGNLDAILLESFMPKPSDIQGIAGLDIEVQKFSDTIKVSGDINMDNLYFEFPGIVKKEKGLKSRANITMLKEGASTRIERLLYTLDIINLDLKGNIKPDKKMDFDIAMDVPGIGRVAPLFFLSGYTTKGDMELKMSLKDMDLPLTKIPWMNGYVKVNNGFLRLPWFKKPLKEVSLISYFKGETLDLKVDRLICGQSSINNLTFSLSGLETPRFSMYVNFDNFNYNDFRTNGGSNIISIYKNSLLARTSGEIHLLARKICLGNFNGEFLDAKGFLRDSKLNIPTLKMNAFDGNADAHGSIDFSGSIPSIFINSRLQKIDSGLFMKTFGEKAYVADGRSSICGNIDLKGNTMKEFIEDINGNVAIYSKDGVIMKWNLLSKILGLLNLYDVFRGKVDLSKEGLPYKKLGATVTAKNGVFFTDDFLIDSPSMVINGRGSLDMKKDEINADIAVSPLVAVSRTIEKVPVLRNIFRDKTEGFLHLSYKVKGSMDNPDISLNFANNVGSRAVEVLKNVLVLPKGIFEDY